MMGIFLSRLLYLMATSLRRTLVISVQYAARVLSSPVFIYVPDFRNGILI
ncbi:hypothetical protein BH11BAC6_BH11BAC6_10310 [soil metagenome]